MEPDKDFLLWKAAGEGRISEIHHFLEEGVNINHSYFEGITALHFATLQGNLHVVTYLAGNGADINKASDSGLSPLMSACSQGLFHIAKFLVHSGANVNTVNAKLETPLMYLCKARQRKSRISSGIGSVQGFYKICHSENTCGCLDLVKLLVEAGTDVNLQDGEGGTALMGFIMSKHFQVAKFLIQNGADPSIVGMKGNTALLLACQLKYSSELIEMLLGAGAEVNCANEIEGTTPLMSACHRGLDNVETLIRAGAMVNATNSKGETALKSAVFASDPAVIACLIQSGVKVDKELILAVIIGYKESIQTLVTHGVSPRENSSIKNFTCEIEYLSRRYDVDSSYFLDHPLTSHLEALNITSLTPFMIALMRKDDAVARYFIKNLFFNPLDVLLLQEYRKNTATLNLEHNAASLNLVQLMGQPWSLFSLSFLQVSFAIGFDSNRELYISQSGLPAPVQRKLLFRDGLAFLPVKEWRQIDITL